MLRPNVNDRVESTHPWIRGGLWVVWIPIYACNVITLIRRRACPVLTVPCTTGESMESNYCCLQSLSVSLNESNPIHWKSYYFIVYLLTINSTVSTP